VTVPPRVGPGARTAGAPCGRAVGGATAR
jgi:hypothetical protein